MKKIVLVGIFLCLVTLTFAKLPDGIPYSAFYSRAIRNFNKIYKNGQDLEWSASKEGGFICRFTEDLITHRAFYDAKGYWICTITGFGGENLSHEIRNIVKSTYFNYGISYVNQIDLPVGKKVYLIQIEDEKNIKTVRVSDEEIKVVEEIEKI